MSNQASIGILAYGSLLADPGEEIAAATVKRIPVTTPFPIEYARSSRTRAGAPTLVPVPEGIGAPVQAQILLMRPDIDRDEVLDRLYRREINRVGDWDVTYDDAEQRAKNDAVVIEAFEDLAGVPTVFYATLKANIQAMLRKDLSSDEKADVLAHLTIGSVTEETYSRNRDGVRYQQESIDHGIYTPLTDLYCARVLQLAGDVSTLEAARQAIAECRGAVPKE